MTGFFVCMMLNLLLQHIAKDRDSIIQIAAKSFEKDAIKINFEKRRSSHPAISFLSDIYELTTGLVQRDEPPLLFVIILRYAIVSK